nr:HEPN domain-containing protein [Anaerolineae bacterium]
MTNHEKAEDFLSKAEWTWGEVERALEARLWAIVYRRAQEVVELTLKGLIILMGAEYPKVHDPAGGFAQLAQERGLEIPKETLAEIQALSSDLAEKRAPAFYGEISISEAQAHAAAEGAARVLQLGRRLKRELGPRTAPEKEAQ